MQHQTDHDLLIEIHTSLENLKESLRGCRANCVTQAEFRPVRAIAFGIVAAICVAVVGALLATTVKAMNYENAIIGILRR